MREQILCLLRHPLFIALVQLAVGLFAAYFLTERWQRWRQRREFEHRAMVKFADLSMGAFNRLTELLVRRVGHGQDDTTRTLLRDYIAYRVGFLALETEIFAAFQEPAVTAEYLALVETAQKLSDMVKSDAPSLEFEQFEPVQDGFLAQRKRCLARMVTEMGFMTKTELQTVETRLRPKSK